MRPELRLASAADAAVLLELVCAFHAEEGYPLDEGAARRALGDLLTDASLGRAWIAWEAGEAQGYVVLAFGFSIEFRGRDALIDELYVRPAARGRGIARALLDEVETACADLGRHAIHLEVEGDKSVAEALYRRRGFTGTARRLLSKRLAAFAAAASLLLAATSSFAWGPDGHRVTGEIAWRMLTPKTKAAVSELLPKGKFDTLAEASAWADTYARSHPREWRWLDPFHFVDIDPKAERVAVGPRCECVIAAVDIHANRLRNPNATQDQKIEALRLLAHFVGDVHQPLHVSHPDMRGGTTIDLDFEGERMTLHRLWDSELLDRKLRQRNRGRSPRWRGYAQSLADTQDAAETARWASSLDATVWADESLALSKQPLFDVQPDESLGDAYFEKAMPVVEQRLAQSGVRLAALLNSIFDPASQLK